MIRKNEQGLTLIELLIAITLLSIIGVLIWSVFLQGTNYSNQAITKNQMQQEARIIIARLTKIHQTSDSYTIESPDACHLIVKDEDKGLTEVFQHDQLCLKLNKSFYNPIEPKDEDLDLELILSDRFDSQNTLKTKFFLHRLKEIESDEENEE